MLMKKKLKKMFRDCVGVRWHQFSQKNYNETKSYLRGHFPGQMISKEIDIP